MKKTGSILSLAIVSFLLMGNSSCESAGVRPFPIHELYVTDLTNRVCVKYQIIDVEAMTVSDGVELPLSAKGPCDRLTGFKRSDFKAGQNWIRDAQKKLQEFIREVEFY